MYYDNIFALALIPGDSDVEWSLCAYTDVCKHLRGLIAEIKLSALEVTLKHSDWICSPGWAWEHIKTEIFKGQKTLGIVC